MKSQRLILPYPDKYTLERQGYHKEIRYPVCIHEDFETLNIQVDDSAVINNLKPCRYGYVVVDWTD